MKLNAIIIDDEESSRLLLKECIRKYHPEITILDLCCDTKEALMSIAKNHPDLLFLDIQMPDMNGLEFFRCISSLNISLQCIITTAYAESAYFKEAIRLGLTDYLLKPVLKEELDAAINNSIQRIASGQHAGNINRLVNVLSANKITFPTTTGAIYIHPEQILYIKAAGKYSELYMQDEKEIIMLGITEMEELLTGSTVLRIDRFMLINKTYIQKVSLQFNKIILNTGASKIALEVSKKGAEKVMEWMKMGN